MHCVISQRIIAAVLLLSHSLMSCYNPHVEIGPLKEAKVPVMTIGQKHKQPDCEDHELPSSHVAAVVQEDLDEENIESVQSKVSQLNAGRDKLGKPFASKKHTSTSLDPTTDSEEQATEKTQQPIPFILSSKPQILPMLTGPSSHPTHVVQAEKRHIQEKENQRHTQQVEAIGQLTDPFQEALHASFCK